MNRIPLGIGNPEDLLYGVLDTEQNFFYLVSCHKLLAEQATALVSRYRPARLELISDAVNWNHGLLDNTVCRNWGIDYTPKKNCLCREIEHNAQTNLLIANLLEFLSVSEKIYNFRPWLSKLARQWIGMDLPSQQLCEQFANDTWFNLATEKETNNYKSVYTTIEKYLDDINSVFDLDIGSVDYKQQIASKIINLPIDQKFKKFFYEF